MDRNFSCPGPDFGASYRVNVVGPLEGPRQRGKEVNHLSPKTTATGEIKTGNRSERDTIAAVLSIIPGLGHVYKGHYRVGLTLCLVGIPVMLWATALVSFATFGLGLVLLPAYWGMVALNAYWEPDWRKGHHWLQL